MVAIGRFSLIRPLRLLDMSFLPFAYHQESMFSPEYLNRLSATGHTLRWVKPTASPSPGFTG